MFPASCGYAGSCFSTCSSITMVALYLEICNLFTAGPFTQPPSHILASIKQFSISPFFISSKTSRQSSIPSTKIFLYESTFFFARTDEMTPLVTGYRRLTFGSGLVGCFSSHSLMEISRSCSHDSISSKFRTASTKPVVRSSPSASCFLAIQGPTNTTFTSGPYIDLISLPWAIIGDTTGAIYSTSSG